MKWNVEILIVAAIIVTLIWGYKMKTDNQQLSANKQTSMLNYVGAINGKHLFEMAFTRQDNILSGTLVNTFEKENKIHGTIDQEGTFLLTEYEGDKKTGILEGQMMPGGKMKGTWSTPDGDKWFPFYLVKTQE